MSFPSDDETRQLMAMVREFCSDVILRSDGNNVHDDVTLLETIIDGVEVAFEVEGVRYDDGWPSSFVVQLRGYDVYAGRDIELAFNDGVFTLL